MEQPGLRPSDQSHPIFTPDIEWCSTVRLQTREEIAAVPLGQPWIGEKSLNPFNEFGKFTRAVGVWAGWLCATDADTGVWKWRLKSNDPITGAVIPTAGGLVFFGDMGGNFYALDAATGQKLWGQKIGGAIGGGVITYAVNGTQKVAAATGYVFSAFPAEIRRAKIAILGIEGDAKSQ
jgi:alcohol dehydrogenase (cytochrome c)